MIVSCNNETIYINSTNIDGNVWDYRDIVKYEFEISENTSSKNISFFLRNDLNYSYRNIFLITSIYTDSLTILSDTSQYTITDQYGRWLGKGRDKKDHYLQFEQAFTFPHNGKYYISIKHGMRENPLKGIRKLGVEIKRNR